jgi:DNA helicase-2/ATP-dependent DNA helicase PcrA
MSIVKSEVRTLNDAQRAFCAAPGGALRLLAPAGCGKTQSLLWRCLHVAEREKKGEKSKFLLFTFTTGARDELKERIHSDPAFKPISSQVTITTLNAWGYKRLKAAGHNLQL